jgi:Tfp pilus assembly protein PilX
MVPKKGYALFVVLLMMLLLLILTTAVSIHVKNQSEQSLLLVAEERALNGADSGIQYALEVVRSHAYGSIPQSYQTSSWFLLENHRGIATCFKVFAYSSGCPAENDCFMSYGETVKGSCGDYPQNLDRIMAVRVVQGEVDSAKGNLVMWSEVLP